MTRIQIEAAAAGAFTMLVGSAIGVGPARWRVVDPSWLSLEGAAGLAVVSAIACLGFALMEHGVPAVLAGVASAAFLVLGATSVLLGLLCGPLVTLSILAGHAISSARADERRRAATPPCGSAMIEESLRLDQAAARADRAGHRLRWLAGARSAHAVEEAGRGDAASAWRDEDVSGVIRAAALDVDETRREMLLRRDLLGAEGVRREVRAELTAPRRRGVA